MAYGSYTYPKFSEDFIVGQKVSFDLLPTTPPSGSSITILSGGAPSGLTINTTTWKIEGTPTADGDFDISFQIEDGITSLISSYTYTFVVLTIDIFCSVATPITFASYTAESATFTYSVTGSYSVADTTELVWSDAGSQKPAGLTLSVGKGTSASISSFVRYPTNFLIHLTVTDPDGHTITKKFEGDVGNVGSVSADNKPDLFSASIVGATINTVLSHKFKNAKEGNKPYSYRFNTNNLTVSQFPILPTSFNSSLNEDTGVFATTPNGLDDWYFYAYLKDNPLSKVLRTVSAEYICGLGLHRQPREVTRAYFSTKTTALGVPTKLYHYTFSTQTISGSPYTQPTGYEIQDVVEKSNDAIILTGPETTAFTYSLRKLVNLAETASSTFTAGGSCTGINQLVLGEDGLIYVLPNTDVIRSYNASTNTIATPAAFSSKNYLAGCSSTASGVNFLWLLNNTDKTLIKYNCTTATISNTYSLPGGATFGYSCTSDRMCNHDNRQILITDSAANKLYIFDIAGGTFASSITLPSGKIPCDVFSDNSNYFVLCQEEGVIRVYNESGTLRSSIPVLNNVYNFSLSDGTGSSVTRTLELGTPLKKGSILIELHTSTKGYVSLTDDSSGTLVSSDSSLVSDGSVDYCTGTIVYDTIADTPNYSIKITYSALSTELGGSIKVSTNETNWITNGQQLIHGFDYVSSKAIELIVGDLSFNPVSTKELHLLKSVAKTFEEVISGGTPSYVSFTTIDGTEPTSMTLDYPSVGASTTTAYSIDGTPSVNGLYSTTISITDSVTTETVWVYSVAAVPPA